MPNLMFIGFPAADAEEIVDCLSRLLPKDMEDAVYMAYPDGAPVYAKTKEPAPYIIVRDSDRTQAERIKDALQRGIDCVDGPPDVEIDIIRFYAGGGEIREEPSR